MLVWIGASGIKERMVLVEKWDTPPFHHQTTDSAPAAAPKKPPSNEGTPRQLSLQNLAWAFALAARFGLLGATGQGGRKRHGEP